MRYLYILFLKNKFPLFKSSKFIPMYTLSGSPPIHEFPFSQFTFSIFLIPFLSIFLLPFQKMISPTSLSSQTMFFPRRASRFPVALYSKIFQYNFTIVPFLIPLWSSFFYHVSPFSFPFKKYFPF